MLTSFDAIFTKLTSLPKKHLVVAWGIDAHSIGAAAAAIKKGFVDVTLVGDREIIEKICAEENIAPAIFNIVPVAEELPAIARAVELVNAGEGDLLMKGMCSTDKYMRAILNKEKGLLPPKAVLSHITLIAHEHYHKLLLVSDIAVIPVPDLHQKTIIISYLVTAAHRLGIARPKVAVVAATEQMLPTLPACVDGAILSKMVDRGQIKDCLLDGPLSLDVSISKEAANIKMVESEVAGDADCLLFPNLEAANVFYKTITQLSPKAHIAAVVTGAKVPCVLSSRGDTAETKLNSIALAALMAAKSMNNE
ncbi:MAG: phosphate butyryltransferase [Prevotellaceae bacterium]|jgi:phosphate butyryltransferase|nr:phosphate butyryltransferase [Prevotellaceae bacterium]